MQKQIVIPFFICLACLAATSTAARESRKFQFGVGAQLAITTHDLCTFDYDVHQCRSFTSGIGPQIHGYYRFARHASIGVLGSFWRILDHSNHVTSDGREYRNRLAVWRTAADLRLYPLKGKFLEWWFAMEMGVTGATDSYVEDALLDARRIHQTGFSMGLGSGIDFHLNRRLLLGFEFRSILLLFGDAPKNTEDVIVTRIGTALWPVFGFINMGVLI